MAKNTLEYGEGSRFWIAIVGMGAGGARLFSSIIDRTRGNERLASSLGFVLVDKRPFGEFGRGIAWSSSQSDVFLANMRLPTMGLKTKVVARVKAELGVEDWNQDDLPEDFQFQVRRIIGEALHEDFLDYVKEATSREIPVIQISDTVRDVAQQGRGWALSMKASADRYVDIVVLALGNVPCGTFPHLDPCHNFISNPWRWDDYANRLMNARVGVAGLGPTAVDAILFANQKGAKSIVAASRSGRMQYPRPKNDPNSPFTLRYLSEACLREQIELKKAGGERGLSYDELMMLIRMEFSEAKACDQLKEVRQIWSEQPAREMLILGKKDADKVQLWYSIMKAVDVDTPFIWNSLNTQAREKYKSSLQTEHQSLSFGMAYKHANTLVSLLDDKKKLFVGKCGDEPQATSQGTFLWNVGGKTHEVDVLINCTGIGSKPDDFDIEIVKNLMKRGWLVPHPDGGFYVDFNSGQIFKNAEGSERLGEIYVLVGSLTRGTHLLTNCLGQLFASCERTAQHISERIAQLIPHGG